jgi:D-alanine-D-alanine ligase
VFVKPVNLGSSVGIAKAHDRDELLAALAQAFAYDRKVIVEAFVEARELECGVLGNGSPEVSVVAEIVPGNEFYDYESKYTDGMMSFAIPADVPAETTEEIRGLAAAAFVAIDCAGFARCDFFFERETGRVLVNEINTIPGLTGMSAFPKVWEASGVPYTALVERIVALALERHAVRTGLRTARD